LLLAIIGWVYRKMTTVPRRDPPDAEQGGKPLEATPYYCSGGIATTAADIRPPQVMIGVLTVRDNIRPQERILCVVCRYVHLGMRKSIL
jgi:hypothetical protein